MIGQKNAKELMMSVEAFMQANGYFSQTGYLGEAQKRQFQERLAQMPHICTIAEIGFNAGHSAECFFESCPNLKGFISFDISLHPYTKPTAEYFHRLHPDRFLFIEGDSQETVPVFASRFPTLKCDLIYIDATHTFAYVMGDILNAKLIAHPQTVLWLDDTHYSEVMRAVEFCETYGLIKIKQAFSPQDAKDPKRTWLEACY